MTQATKLLAMAVVVGLTGCSGYFRDRSMDYRQAISTPPLPLPAASRPVQPLLSSPPARQPFDASKPFVVPYPPRLKIAEVTADPEPQADSQGKTVVKLGTDGSGVPELRVVGPRERVWDELAKALQVAGITIKDRNQSLGIVDVIIAEQAYQLRMIRAAEAFVIGLQRNDEQLAPAAVSRELLSTLQVRWP